MLLGAHFSGMLEISLPIFLIPLHMNPIRFSRQIVLHWAVGENPFPSAIIRRSWASVMSAYARPIYRPVNFFISEFIPLHRHRTAPRLRNRNRRTLCFCCLNRFRDPSPKALSRIYPFLLLSQSLPLSPSSSVIRDNF
jgi:hypothetical protein